MSSKTVLITRALAQNSTLRSWAINGKYKLIEQPFIRFEKIPNLEIPVSDWIFFSSPNGVRIYLENYKIQAKKIGALSNGTVKILKENNINVDFVGQANQSTIDIGLNFANQLNKREIVLFPLSDISKKNISNQLTDEQKIELEIYKTVLLNQKIKQAIDVIIFTSPSNVLGFFECNQISTSALIVAIGESTKVEIEKHTPLSVTVANSYNEESIVDVLNQFTF